MLSTRQAVNTDSEILFQQGGFIVTITRDNQKCPGILDIMPDPRLQISSWSDFTVENLSELSKIQRQCEFLLMNTFYANEADHALINNYAREMVTQDSSYVKVRIIPRFHYDGEKKVVAIDLNGVQPVYFGPAKDAPTGDHYKTFTDPAPKKPFEYVNPLALAEHEYMAIVSLLRSNLTQLKLAEKQDQTAPINHEHCFMCKHAKDHPDGAGLMEVEVYFNGQAMKFKFTLDARDQSHPGRGYVVPLHYEALRSMDDAVVAVMHKLANAYQSAVKAIYPEDNITFDRAVLMNLYDKKAGGPHVHMHVIGRNPAKAAYDMEYPMLASGYIALTKDPDQKRTIIGKLSNALHEAIMKDEFLSSVTKVSYMADKPAATTPSMQRLSLFADKEQEINQDKPQPYFQP